MKKKIFATIIFLGIALQSLSINAQEAQQPADPAGDTADALLLVDSLNPRPAEDNFEKIARYYGLYALRFDLSQSEALSFLQAAESNSSPAIYIHAELLETLSDEQSEALLRLVNAGSSLYIDAFPSRLSVETPIELPRLARLTNHVLLGLRRPIESVKEWAVADILPRFSQHFSGKIISGIKGSQRDWGIRLNARALTGPLPEPLITAKDFSNQTYPVTVRLQYGQGSLFIDASQHDGRIGDAPQGIPLRQLFVPEHFSAVVPLMMYFRFVFGDGVWHNDRVYANLTIDDPLLTNPHGFLDYEKLLLQMRQFRFHTTIGFVPTNYDESESSVVRLFAQNPSYYSLVVHGNDHDEAECQKTQASQAWEEDLLEGLVRMHEHERLTGLPFGRLMIFPCKIAQLSILQLLKKYNYVATVNAQEGPLDIPVSTSWEFEMRPMNWDYANLPSSTRWLMSDSTVIRQQALFNAFIGKPLLIWGHHDHFRNGIEAFNPIAQTINALLPKVRWQGLEKIAEQAYLWKRNRDASISVFMYSQTLHLENAENQNRLYRIQKPESGDIPIHDVRANGQPISFVVKNRMLKFELTLPPGEQAKIQVLYRNRDIDLTLSISGYDEQREMLSTIACNDGDDATPFMVGAFEQNVPGTSFDGVLSPVMWIDAQSCRSLTLSLGRFAPGHHNLALRVDPYDELVERREDNNAAAIEVMTSGLVIVDNFDEGSPLQNGWTVVQGQGRVEAIFDATIESYVLRLISAESTKFAVRYPGTKNLKIRKGRLVMRLNAPAAFIFYVAVRAEDGKDYFLQYMPGEGKPQTYKDQFGFIYNVYYLGNSPAGWQRLERSLQEDLFRLQGVRLKYVKSFSIRGGHLLLDDLVLKD